MYGKGYLQRKVGRSVRNSAGIHLGYIGVAICPITFVIWLVSSSPTLFVLNILIVLIQSVVRLFNAFKISSITKKLPMNANSKELTINGLTQDDIHKQMIENKKALDENRRKMAEIKARIAKYDLELAILDKEIEESN